jgi:hypothetical protein
MLFSSTKTDQIMAFSQGAEQQKTPKIVLLGGCSAPM